MRSKKSTATDQAYKVDAKLKTTAGLISRGIGRRELLLGLGGSLAVPNLIHAEPKRTPLVGLLSGWYDPIADVAKGLKETGYVNRQNVTIREVNAYEQYDRLPKMAADLVRRGVDVIAAYGTIEALAVRQVTTTVPVVFLAYDDPVQAGLAASLAHPGGNFTGILLLHDVLMAKRLDLLSELVPQAGEFALMVNPRQAYAPAVIQSAQQAAQKKGLTLRILKAYTQAEMTAALANIKQTKVGGLIVDYGQSIAQVSLLKRAGIPAIYSYVPNAKLGGLISYGPEKSVVQRQMGVYVGRVLNGEKPADLPFAQPDKIVLAINLKAAKALGITVPQGLLARADKVIE